MRFLLLTTFSLFACARAPEFVEYREPGGEFSVQVPRRWKVSERGPFTRRPVAEVWWIGKVVETDEGWPVGAILYVRRLDKDPDKRNKVYINEELADTKALFAGKHAPDVQTKKSTMLGHESIEFVRDYEEAFGGGWHGKLHHRAARVEGVVIDTPGSYYVLEYRATKELFEKYRYGFMRLRESFKLKGA